MTRQEQDLNVADNTVSNGSGQLLVIKPCLCPIIFCSYICLNIVLFPKNDVFRYSAIKRNVSLHADGGQNSSII